MAKIDVYLRSIERFGATGAVLSSGQAVTLKFPQGDRTAQQVTPHDQIVPIVREVAPPAALDQIDRGRPASFDVDSAGVRYRLDVTPRPNAWQVVIAPAPAAAAAAPAAPAAASQSQGIPRTQPRAPTPPPVSAEDMAIERGQYDLPEVEPTTAGGSLLDQLCTAARSARASDIYLSTDAPPAIRAAGELHPVDRAPLDAETISRELGVIAPGEARAAWTEGGHAVFAYGEPGGRVRVTLTRDHHGPAAALRLLPGEPPGLDKIGLGRDVSPWLDQRGLVLVAGPSGSGRTTAIAALVRALGERRKRVVSIEEPIELIQGKGPFISQRAVGLHVPSVLDGVVTAMKEGADAIVLGSVATADVAHAVLDAVAGGHLVVAAITAGAARHGLDALVALVAPDRREHARAILDGRWVGTIGPISRGGSRSYEVVAGRAG